MYRIFALIATHLALLCGLLLPASSAWAEGSARPAPLGIEVGASACRDAAAKLGGPIRRAPESQAFVVEAGNPSALYQGASGIEAWCARSDGPVLILKLTLPKGGLGNPGAAEVYSNLAAKYKRVAGGAPPAVGNGYARFEASDAVIELRAPHMSFEFEVEYMTREVYTRWQASEAQRRQEEAKAKRDRL